MNRSFLAILFVVAGLFVGGCQTAPNGYIQMPRAPAWQAPKDPTPLGIDYVVLRLKLQFPNTIIYASDAVYMRVNHEWLLKTIPWSWEAAKSIGFDYVDNSRNCTKFAIAYYLAASNSAANAGVKMTPLVARLTVAQDHSFAGVPGKEGTRHALIGVLSDEGMFVIEPQSNGVGAPRITPLEKYPNRILSITLGDPAPP